MVTGDVAVLNVIFSLSFFRHHLLIILLADWRIILGWIFRKWEGVVRTGWSWLRLGTGGGNL